MTKEQALAAARARYPGHEIVPRSVRGEEGRSCVLMIRVPSLLGNGAQLSAIAGAGVSWGAAIANMEHRLQLQRVRESQLSHCDSCNCMVGPGHDCSWLGIARCDQSLP